MRCLFTSSKVRRVYNQTRLACAVLRDRALKRETIYLSYSGMLNAGDLLTPFLYRAIAGRQPPPNVGYRNSYRLKNVMAVGSILRFADENTIVWGSGLDNRDGKLGCQGWGDDGREGDWVKAIRVLAVRGPLTASVLRQRGVDCPEVFGDPGLLMPMFYRPCIDLTSKLGLVRHFSHESSIAFTSLIADEGTKQIAVRQRPKTFVNELLACRFIASSSLHGIILADAYRIPWVWVWPAGNRNREWFKYHDYFLSQGRDVESPCVVSPEQNVEQIVDQCSLSPEFVDREQLLKACPF